MKKVFLFSTITLTLLAAHRCIGQSKEDTEAFIRARVIPQAWPTAQLTDGHTLRIAAHHFDNGEVDRYVDLDLRFQVSIVSASCMSNTVPCILFTDNAQESWNVQFPNASPASLNQFAKALRHLAQLDGAKLVDDDMFK